MSRRAVGLILAIVLAAPAGAQVDPAGEWRTLHTTHFRIHFRPHYRGIAQQAANEAERAYALLASTLPAPRGVIDVTLSDDVDAANGFANQVPSNRFTLLLTTGATELPLQRFDSWLRVGMVHELAHIFHLDRAHGLWRVLQTVFGRAPGLFPNAYQPSWVVEGLATYYESRFTGAGRVGSDIHTEVLAAQHAYGPQRTPWSAVFYHRWPGGWAPYAYGGQFMDAAFDLVGDSALRRYVGTTSRQLIPFRVARPYRRATGRQMQEDWHAFTRIGPAAPPAVDAGVVLARGLRSPALPRLSPDGRLVAYHHDDGRAAPELRVVELEGWRLLRRRRVTTSVSFDWLGDTLLVAQLEFTARRRVRSDLYVWLPDGTWRRESRGQRLTVPRAGGGVRTAIALTPGGQQPVVAGRPLADTAGTSWGALAPSPDGQWIAATRHRDGGWALVRWPTVWPDSVAVLVASREVISEPVWSRDQRLFFVMPAAGMPQVHEWTADGPVVRTAAPLGARGPAPIPGAGDGAFLYSTLSGDGWELRRDAPAPPAAADVPPPVPFDSAPPVGTRETGYAGWPSLRPHYWLPTFVDAGAAGRFVGATTSGHDVLGRTSYVLHALGSGAPLRGLAGVRLVSEVLGSPTLDIGAANDWTLVGVTSGGVAVAEHTVEASAGASFVTRRWRTSATLRFAVEGERTRYHTEPERPIASVCTGCVARDVVSGAVSLRVAHFESAPLAVSAQNGFVWSALYRRREELRSTGWSGEAQSRLALYARLPAVGYAHPVLALRLAGGVTHGPSPQLFGVGGVSSSVVDLGFGFSLGTSRAFPIRGYVAGDARGRRALTATAELRWPVALLGRALGALPVGGDQLSLALFADAGDGWDGSAGPHPSRLWSVGAEAVADLRVSYDLPLRARLGVALPRGSLDTGRARSPVAYGAFAADF